MILKNEILIKFLMVRVNNLIGLPKTSSNCIYMKLQTLFIYFFYILIF